MTTNPAQQIHDFGTSLWYDDISRDLVNSGELAKLITNSGIRGLTSNPSIFDNAIRNSGVYDAEIKDAKSKGLNSEEIFENLAIVDIGLAADVLMGIYEESEGEDGFVSIEVSPKLARNTEQTLVQAKRFIEKLQRPNIMIKVPGTAEGIPAVRALLEEGISVNITLLFSVPNYEEVARAYIEALSSRHSKGKDISKVRSVASFFVSRVDTEVDSALDKIGTPEALALKGKFGIANSKLAYKKFQDVFDAEFDDLQAAGAKPQRPLWASTGVKNPAYRDTMYIEQLVGPQTVNTLPAKTLDAFVEHGEVSTTVTKGVHEAFDVQEKLLGLGVSIGTILDDLQKVGVQKFIDSYDSLLGAIESK